MKPVNLYQMYQMGATLRFFDSLSAETKLGDIRKNCAIAIGWFDTILNRDKYPLSDTVRNYATILKSFCEQVMVSDAVEKVGDKNHKVTEFAHVNRFNMVKEVFGLFEAVFAAELSRFNIYFVTKLGAYDTDTLLSSGRVALPEVVVSACSEDALKCFDEGTRCLALKLPTAAGFNLLRAVESVLHQYYDVVSNGAPRPKRRNMGDYIDELEKVTGKDDRMAAVLRDIKNLRRNPLMHPEDFLEIADALITFDVAKSTISIMTQLALEHARNSVPKAK